jgi:hypothetical protein
MKPPRNSRPDMLCAVEKVWGVGGRSFSYTRRTWRLDGGDVVEGVGGGGLATGLEPNTIEILGQVRLIVGWKQWLDNQLQISSIWRS